jgi:hypothetical protein
VTGMARLRRRGAVRVLSAALFLPMIASRCASRGGVSPSLPAEDSIRVSVRQVLVYPAQPGQHIGVAAEVLFRDVDGRVLFRSRTDDAGRLTIPVDYHRLRPGQEIEARVVDRTWFFGGVVAVVPELQTYRIVLPPNVAVFGD